MQINIPEVPTFILSFALDNESKEMLSVYAKEVDGLPLPVSIKIENEEGVLEVALNETEATALNNSILSFFDKNGRFNSNIPSLKITDNNHSLHVIYDNYGEPFRQGLSLGIYRDKYECILSVFCEERDIYHKWVKLLRHAVEKLEANSFA